MQDYIEELLELALLQEEEMDDDEALDECASV